MISGMMVRGEPLATLLLYDPAGRLADTLQGLDGEEDVQVVSLETPPEVFMALEELAPRALVVPLDRPEDGAMDLLEAMNAMGLTPPRDTAFTSRRHSFGDVAVSAARKLVSASVFVPHDQLDAWLRDRMGLPPAPVFSTLTFDAQEARTEMAQNWVLREIEDDPSAVPAIDRTEVADAAVLREIIDDDDSEYSEYGGAPGAAARAPAADPVVAELEPEGLWARFKAWWTWLWSDD